MRETEGSRRRAEQGSQLERATAAYFEDLPPRAIREEAELEFSLDRSADEIGLAAP